MTSKINNIMLKINQLNNLSEVEFIQKMVQFDIAEIVKEINGSFIDDDNQINIKLKSLDLNQEFNRLKNDFNYRNHIGILRGKHKIKIKKERLLFFLARLIIHKKMINQLFILLKEYKIKLLRKSDFLKERKSFQYIELNKIFAISHHLNATHGLLREIESSISDYFQYYNIILSLIGIKSNKERKFRKSDIQSFQVDAAIKELLCSRTESCQAASLLIRNLLEFRLKRMLFIYNPYGEINYYPTRKLSIPVIFKSFKKVNIKFNYPYELLLAVWDNLNLIIHIGYWLSPVLLWYFYGIVKNIVLIKDKKIRMSDNEFKRRSLLKVLKVLEGKKLVKAIHLDKQERLKEINITWRI